MPRTSSSRRLLQAAAEQAELTGGLANGHAEARAAQPVAEARSAAEPEVPAEIAPPAEKPKRAQAAAAKPPQSAPPAEPAGGPQIGAIERLAQVQQELAAGQAFAYGMPVQVRQQDELVSHTVRIPRWLQQVLRMYSAQTGLTIQDITLAGLEMALNQLAEQTAGQRPALPLGATKGVNGTE